MVSNEIEMVQGQMMIKFPTEMIFFMEDKILFIFFVMACLFVHKGILFLKFKNCKIRNNIAFLV